MKAKLFGGVAVSALLCIAACGDDDGASGGAGGATTATTTTDGPTTTGPTTTATTTTASTTAMSSSSTGMAVCPEDPNDPACIACAKESCCDQTEPCLADPECSTCLGCVANATDPADCVLGGDCDLADPETSALYDCTAGACTTECYNGGFSCDPDPKGSPCIECVKTDCCNQAQDCFESALCAQCIQCAQSAANPLECVDSGDCNLGDPATGQLLNCVNNNCGECL